MPQFNNNPAVSFIVPVYNVKDYLPRCIESLSGQTLCDFEIILVDDGSTDGCSKLCDDAARFNSRIRVVHKENAGLGFARNTGLEIALGRYVYFVDSDDYLAKNAAWTLCKFADKNRLDVCFGGIYLESSDGKASTLLEERSVFSGRVMAQPEITTQVLSEMLGSLPGDIKDFGTRMSVWQGLYRRSFLASNNLKFSSERVYASEDIVFHLNALPKAERVGYVDECLYYHTIDNAASLTHAYNPKRFERYCTLYEEETRLIKACCSCPDEMILRAQRGLLANTRACLKQIAERNPGAVKIERLLEIKQVINDPRLRSVLNQYPYRENPRKQALLSFFMDKGLAGCVFLLTIFWNLIQKGR